jgi:hypothetical protein
VPDVQGGDVERLAELSTSKVLMIMLKLHRRSGG